MCIVCLLSFNYIKRSSNLFLKYFILSFLLIKVMLNSTQYMRGSKV